MSTIRPPLAALLLAVLVAWLWSPAMSVELRVQLGPVAAARPA